MSYRCKFYRQVLVWAGLSPNFFRCKKTKILQFVFRISERGNNYYASVGVKDDKKIPSCIYNTVTDILETVSFTELSIIFAINKLKPNLSSRPNNLPPLLFKQLKLCLAGPLSLLFTQLLSVSAVSEDWTKAIIIPAFKKEQLLMWAITGPSR